MKSIMKKEGYHFLGYSNVPNKRLEVFGKIVKFASKCHLLDSLFQKLHAILFFQIRQIFLRYFEFVQHSPFILSRLLLGTLA